LLSIATLACFCVLLAYECNFERIRSVIPRHKGRFSSIAAGLFMNVIPMSAFIGTNELAKVAPKQT
jgi:hypothetical protein